MSPAVDAPGAVEPSGSRSDARGIDLQPDDEYFDIMAKVAESHWWYRGRRAWLAQELGRYLPANERALDIGCGTGEAMGALHALGAAAPVGTDLSEHVLGHVRRRDRRTRVLKSLAEQLPFRDGAAGTLISMDVIEHLDDDVLALREYRRALRPGGVLFITVPSYPWLWSEHDDRAAHRRRYTVGQLEGAVRAAGFEIDRATYYFSFLVPPAILLRRTPLRRWVRATDDEVSSMHPVVDAGFAALARFERMIGRRRNLPFGLSILLVAHRPLDP